MPRYYRKRTYKRPYKKRGRKAKRKFYGRKGKYANFMRYRPYGFMDQYFCKLKYCEQIPFTTGTGADYRFSLNNISDPNVTGVGHQPMYHDQLEGIFNHYRVYAAKYKITLTNLSATEFVRVCVRADAVTTAATSFGQASEQKGAIIRFLTNDQDKTTIKGYCRFKNLVGREAFGSDDYSAVFGSAPVKVIQLHTFIDNEDESTAIEVRAYYEITYYVKCYKVIVQS